MRLLLGLVFALAEFFPQSAGAQGIPNLVDTWKGTANAVSVGSNPYRPPETKEPFFSSETLEFTFVIKEQRDNRFSGTSMAGNRTETLVGSISPDGKSGVVLDDDGEYLFTVRDNDTLDTCYRHSNAKSKVVACYSWKRQK